MNKTILVLINGHAGVGKDTFVDFCKNYAEKEKSCRVYNIHRSDAPKKVLQAVGWDGEKDAESRILLKRMVDFMENKGILDRYLDTQIMAAKVSVNRNSILFYHVRDPEIIYSLMDKYIDEAGVKPISLLLKRDIDKPAEPNDWWGNLENGDYTMSIQLPPDDLECTEGIAKHLVDFLVDTEWNVTENRKE